MSLFFIAMKDEYISEYAVEAFARIKADQNGKDSSPYVAFTTKELGKKYLKARNMEKTFSLLTLEQHKERGFKPDMNNGTLIFENEQEISNTLSSPSAKVLRELIR